MKRYAAICDISIMNQVNLIPKSMRWMYKEVYLFFINFCKRVLLNKMGGVLNMQPIHLKKIKKYIYIPC